MKKTVLFFMLLPLMAMAAFAQESRQDVSVSGAGLYSPKVVGNTVQQTATLGVGVLTSYRYMLTPHSALEGNYSYMQKIDKYVAPFNDSIRVHARYNEASGAYVYSFNFRNFNPFVEAGIAGVFLRPIKDNKTTDLDAKGTTQIGGLYGGGIAYEISPSFDIRVQYRGIVMKAPSYGLLPGNASLNTNRYYNLVNPTIGIAYHF